MKARIGMLCLCSCFWLISSLSAIANAQQDPQSQLVRVNKGETVDFLLKYLRPTEGGDPHADTVTPWGKASVTRNDNSTSIDVHLGGFPRNPGRYFVYLVREDNSAKQIAKFENGVSMTDKESSQLGSFRLAVSTEPGLTTIEPRRGDVIMVSIAPHR